PSGPPLVSVVVVLLNRAPLTFGCLTALLAASPPWVELVMVDNGSTDSTSRLLQRVRGATIVRNERNLGFAAAVNQGARAGSGQYLLLLNNDAQLLPGSLEAALRRLETRSDAGAVGGRLVWPDGRLQEAGSVVFDDGTCRGYGRGARALDGEYMFARDVDFCSGAFLLTARQTFMESGGFDEVFSPAYYEDVDYCVRLRGAGRLILYEPRAAAIHFEFGSATSVPEALEAQATGRKRFVEKHRDWLRRQMAPGSILQARSRRGEGLRVVVFDDRVPHPELGSGLGRSAALLRALVELGHFVTFYPLGVTEEEWGRVYHVLPDTVEVMLGRGAGGVGDFVRERRGYYDCTIVSRAPNMRLLQAALRAQGAWPPSKALIYDAEAVAACRELARRRVAGEPVQATEAARLLSEELQLGASAGLVFSVSARERERFVEAGIEDVRVLSYPIEPTPTRAPFDERLGLLFAGGFSAPSPSADSVTWFAAQVLPRLRAAAGADLRFCVAGATPPPEVARLTGQGVDILGCVEDLTALYDRSRVFVAPTRFAAGIPLKVLDAAAHGLPVVCTSLLADQLGWRDGEQLLVADDPATFADCCLALHHDAALWHRLRRAALDRIALDCSPEAFRDTLRQALTSLITSRAPR
ncbi:MAG TPA: glycosyltransferase, partial [Vicinamibacterales bacterium]|nr:glycosyltransferase [Vicinamibacterales bacterium]